MRIAVPFILLMFTAFFVVFSNAGVEINPADVRHNLTTINDILFNLTTETIQYTNLYEEEPTFSNVLYNIAHGIMYGITVELNTMMPIAIETAGGRYAATIFKFVIWWVVLMLVFSLPRIVTMIIALVFFIKEKKKSKTKFYQ